MSGVVGKDIAVATTRYDSQKGEESFAKLLKLSIHNNLLKHQNWMYKEWMERVAKSNR